MPRPNVIRDLNPEAWKDGKKEPLLPSTTTNGAASSRWKSLSILFRHGGAFQKSYMAAHAKIIQPSQIPDQYPVAKKLSRKTVESMGNLFAPADVKPEPPPNTEEAALQTNGEAIVNLLNNCLGSGMLTMGYAIAHAGIIPALITMALSAFLNRFTLLLNLRTCRLAGADPASAEIGEKTFGVAGRVMMICLYAIFGFLCCVSYVDAAADAVDGMAQLILGFAPHPGNSLFGCWFFLLLPTTLIRSLKAVALLSFVAFMGGVVMLITVSIYCAEELLDTGFPSITDLDWTFPSFDKFVAAFPILLLIFSIQAGGGVVLATMRDTSEANVNAVSRNAYLLVIVMDFFIGIIAYVTFLQDVEGNVLLNFSPSNPVAIIARVALLDLVVLSYMIMMIPCKLSLIDLLFGKNEARMESSVFEFYAVTLALNIAALGLAFAVSDLSLVNGLNGAVCTNLIAFILPVMFFVKTRKTEEGGGIPYCSCANVPYYFIAAFGLFSLVSSSSSIVARMSGGAAPEE